MYWQPSEAIEIATWSLPHADNEHQWSINDLWLCILGNLTRDWLQTFINDVLDALRVQNNLWSQLATKPECSFKIRDRQSEKK